MSNDYYKSYSIGIEHRWENSFDARLEYYFNGFGSKQDLFSLPEMFLRASENRLLYPGREYLALGQGYEVSPLLYMQLVLLMNLNNQAGIISLNTTYSLSDDFELSVNAATTYNKRRDDLLYSTEFFYSPNALAIELRGYF
ncbi:MAG: hypothetical protein JKY01_04890 [Pseudomonadales bacterium]|nr:hypothetical protein [Pseudomonadales bacterium]